MGLVGAGVNTVPCSSVTIREAGATDLDAIIAMGMRFGAETAYGRIIETDPERLRALASGLVTSPDAVLFVSEEDDGIAGMIGLVVCQHAMSLLRVCSELVWWVNPDARGHGRALMDAAEAWAIERDADLLFMIAPNETVGRLYQRAGYQPLEAVFYRRL